MSEWIKIDDLKVEVRRSSRRKHVDLSVDRGGEVVVSVPDKLETEEIEKAVRSKLVWIYSTLGRKRETQSREPLKEFVSGEGFYYLGRKYRLQMCPPANAATKEEPFVFSQNRFYLHESALNCAQSHFIKWYTKEASKWIEVRVDTLKARVNAKPTGVGICDLGFRWASCTRSGKLNFHWRTILLPAERLDYLVLHELVHLHEHNHSPAFYERLERACPNHKRHEAWFRLHGDKYSL